MVSYSAVIKQKPKDIPTSPGVYFFKGPRGKILYIGKAANLKSRLASYFSKQRKDPRFERMFQEATGVKWQELDSEIEAFLTEAEMIKENRPPYNIALRDDKRYSHVVITDDAFPKIYISHQPEPLIQETVSQVFGPFVDGGALRSTLKLFRRIFPYCTCKRPHHNWCLNYHLGQCLGFCCLYEPAITDQEYREYQTNIRAIKELLNGRRQSLLKEMEKSMKSIAQEGDLEEAIDLREKISKIKTVFENARVIKEISSKTDVLAQIQRALGLDELPQRIEGYDVSNIQGKFATGSMAVFTNGNPDKNEYRKFRIKIAGLGGDPAMLKEVLSRRFNHPEWQYPDLIVIDGGKGQINAALSVLKTRHLKTPTIGLTKDEHHFGKHIYINWKKKPIPLKKLPDGIRNLILHLDSEAHRFAIGYYRKLHRRVVMN